MAKIFVTIVGATGQTGRSVADALLESGSFVSTSPLSASNNWGFAR